jgi:hypothetical protein
MPEKTKPAAVRRRARENVVRFSRLNNVPNTTGEPRFQHLAAHLHALGPRATYELLREIAAGADIFERLERYGQLDRDVVEALGADRMPPRMVLVHGDAQ